MKSGSPSRRTDLPPITVAPRREWTRHKNADINRFCRTCGTDVSAIRADGTCMWCDHQVTPRVKR